MTSIKISQWKEPVRPGKGTVLDRALRQGVPYPHQCRSGECGRCKSRLINGSVKQFPCLDTALSEQEKTDNLVLACRCEPTTDIEVAWLAADLIPEVVNTRYTVEVVGLQRVGRVTRLIVKQSPAEQPLRFVAGQYVYFHLPGCPAVNAGVKARLYAADPCSLGSYG